MIYLMIAFVLLITAFALVGPRVLGELMYRQEAARLIQRGAHPNHINPPIQRDDFSDGIGSPWAFNIINGANQIGRAPAFHNSSVSIQNGGLLISQFPDPNFSVETREEQYNNATLIGFQGYQPTPAEDVLFQATMQVSPNFYGSAGMMVQPRSTILETGEFVGPFNNQAFTLFGICFLGPESSLMGSSGPTTEMVINWWPVQVQPLPIDMYQPHTYTLRLRWLDEKTWLGITSVDGKEVSRMEMPPLGPLELHIWGDNYKIGTAWNGAPEINFQSGEAKWVRFQQVSAWTEPVSQ